MREELLNIELDEEFLDENLPRDLAKAYQRAELHSSQRHPNYSHNEVNGGGTRRAVKYDYGNSTYELKSAEEAISIIKANKQECHNFRIIINNDLVEFEVRDNGSIYPIYGSSDSVDIEGKHYKNIRYVNWKVILQNADKIYYTDEYDHPISDEILDRRKNNSKLKALYHGIGPDDPAYDPHKPHDNMKQKVDFAASEPDTGDHRISRRLAMNNLWTDTDTIYGAHSSSFRAKRDTYTKAYAEAQENKHDVYIRLNNARKALKKLEAEKADLDQEDYEEKKEAFEKKLKEYQEKYRIVAKQCADEKSKIVKFIDERSEESNRILLDYTQDIQRILTRSYEIKRDYESLKTRVLTKKGYPAENDPIIQDNIKRINKAYDSIDRYIKKLTEIQKEIDEYRNASLEINAESDLYDPSKVSSAEDEIRQISQEIKEQSDIIEEISKLQVVGQIKKLKAYEDELKELNQEISVLRPKAAAKKAANQAKQRTPELDPSLADIIEFTDFTNI